MRYLLLLGFIMSSSLFSGSLVFTKGDVMAHTSVFGDSTINPHSSTVVSHLTIDNQDITTLKGSVDVSLVNFKSDNSERDEHMGEALDIKKYTQTTYTIQSVTPSTNGQYTIAGTLNLHGTTKPITLKGEVITQNNQVTIKVETSFKMSEFGIQPPKLLFLNVRDQVDMKIDTTYSQQ